MVYTNHNIMNSTLQFINENKVHTIIYKKFYVISYNRYVYTNTFKNCNDGSTVLILCDKETQIKYFLLDENNDEKLDKIIANYGTNEEVYINSVESEKIMGSTFRNIQNHLLNNLMVQYQRLDGPLRPGIHLFINHGDIKLH